MQEWILIISLSILSSILLTSIITSRIFIVETAIYFNTQIQSIILLYNMFNYFYIIFGLMIIPWLNKYLIPLLEAGLFLTVFTSLGVYVVGDSFMGYVVLVPLQAMAYVLMMAVPFGFINLFAKNMKTYVASVMLFLPTFLSNIFILYGKTNIYYSYPIRDPTKIQKQLNGLNLLITLLSIKCSMVVLYLVKSTLYNEIKKLYKRKDKDIKGAGLITAYVAKVKKEFSKFDKELLVCIGCWGTIIGVSLAFGNEQMVEIFFGQSKTQKSPQFYTQTQVISNVISFILTNFLTSLSFKFNHEGYSTKLTNYQILFLLNIVGLLAAIFIQASISLTFAFLHHKFCIIAVLVILKIGLYYSAVYVLAELSYYGSMVIMGFGLIFVANVVQIYLLEMLDRLNDSKIFIYITLSIWICIYAIQKLRGTNDYHYGFKNMVKYQKNLRQHQLQEFQQDKFIQEI